jgi:hypothetical protein
VLAHLLRLRLLQQPRLLLMMPILCAEAMRAHLFVSHHHRWSGVRCVPELDEEPVLGWLADLLDGSVHDENLSPPVTPGPDEDDEVDVRVWDDAPLSPPSALNLVMTSRNDGRIVGSWCQHVQMRSTNSAGQVASSPWGSGGRALSRITATATAAGLRR